MKVHVLPEERRHEILNILAKDGKLTVPDLSRVLKVSVDTVRRDLNELEQAGHLARVHGGALPRSPSTPPYSARKVQNKTAREEVARETAQIVMPGQIVLFDSGTTALEIARYLSPDLTATVVTVSPPVAMALSTHANIDIIMLPGTLDKSSMSVTGSATLAALKRVRADICISGVCSIHPEIGVTSTSYEEAEIKRQMIDNATEVIVPATADKLGTAVPFEVTGIENINQLVTESSVPLETLTPYHDAGINVIRAKKI